MSDRTLTITVDLSDVKQMLPYVRALERVAYCAQAIVSKGSVRYDTSTASELLREALAALDALRKE